MPRLIGRSSVELVRRREKPVAQIGEDLGISLPLRTDSPVTNPNMHLALGHFGALANSASSGWSPDNPEDYEAAVAVFESVGKWIAASAEHAAVFLVVTQAYIAASEQLIAERVEGADPGEFLEAALEMLNQSLGADDDGAD